MAHGYKFQNLSEYFVDYPQLSIDGPSVNVTTQPSFGLIDRSYEHDVVGDTRSSWERFADHVNHLNKNSLDGVSYKVLFLTRHGRGYHNEQEAKVGRDAWDNYWSLLDGTTGTNGEAVVWADAHLLPEGIQQAKDLSKFWIAAVEEEHVPLPATIYTSPLARCLETTKHIFSEPMQQFGQEFRPVVKELLRERLTSHTCDRRSSRTWIESQYPSYVIEPSFSEDDLLWKEGQSETDEEHIARKQKILEEIFSTNSGTYLSLTVHFYAITAILAVCGSVPFRVRVGSTIALLVRGEKVGLSK